MTQKNDIVDYFVKSMDTEISLQELYDAFPFPQSSIRRIMGVETKKELFERTEKGVYKLIERYFKIAMTKTSHYKNKSKGDVQIDATIAGWVRADMINFTSMRIDPSVKQNLNAEFISIIIDFLQDDNDFFSLGIVELHFKIQGTEIRKNDFDYAQAEYNEEWEVEEITCTTTYGEYVVTENDTATILESDLY